MAYLALSFVRISGSGLVLVASLPSTCCHLLPHQTSSESWLMLAGSSFSIDTCSPSHLFADFQEISEKSQSSGKFPGSVARLVDSFVFHCKEFSSCQLFL